MKKTHFIVAIVVWASMIYSCKKEVTDSRNNISANFNNDHNATKFTNSVFANIDTFGGTNRLRITADQGAFPANNLLLTVTSVTPITTGVYHNNVFQPRNGPAFIDYIPSNISYLYKSSLYPIDGTSIDNSIVTITSIDSLVQGTFSGTVYFPFYSSIQPINFSDGKFKAKMVK